MKPFLITGRFYSLPKGPAEYLGIDTFRGERTCKFKDYDGGFTYLYDSQLDGIKQVDSFPCRTCGALVHEPAWMTREEIGKKITETSRAMLEGYERAISDWQTDAEKDANRKCGVAASNTGYFILQSLGFSSKEIRDLVDAAREAADGTESSGVRALK